MAKKLRSESIVRSEVIEAEGTWLQQRSKTAPMKMKSMSRAP